MEREMSPAVVRSGEEREMRAATAAGQRLGREMRAAATRSGEERERETRTIVAAVQHLGREMHAAAARLGERDARSSYRGKMRERGEERHAQRGRVRRGRDGHSSSMG